MGRLDMLTAEQKRAVTDRGGALLVSAAAGSGKTRVLVERLLERVCDPDEGCNIDDFLIITYTNAAAAELRGKIMEGINSRLADTPNDRRLRRQQMLCHRAHIGTIHSFCTTVLRENAQLASLAPDFRVADESESRLLRSKAMEDMLEACYENMTEGFAALLDTMSAGQDDSALADLVLETYGSLQSHPYPEKWCNEHIARLAMDGVTDLSLTPWGRELITYAKERAAFLLGRLDRVLEDWDTDEKFQKAYAPTIAATRGDLLAFIAALDEGWDAACAAAEISFPRAGQLRGEQYDGVKAIREQVKKAAKEFPGIFKAPSAQLIGDMALAAPVVKELLHLVMRFEKEYSALKRRRGVIDFNDQEHLALSLLVDSRTNEPSALARELSQRFCEVMVDEYQDVNRVQELIISSVTRGGRNLFMVGDVKQSIYRFRLADPTIFLEKYNAYPMAEDAADGQPRKVILSRNFRSREGVLEAANYLFSNIMSTGLGEMDYTPAEYLYPGAKYPPSDETCVELNILDLSGEDDDADDEAAPNKIAAEADWVARRMLRLKADYRVREGEGTRPARWSDFALLLRSLSGRGAIYTAALAAHGIPVASGKAESFFRAPEVSFMLSYLTVIDNPRQDIPLISVLRSPVYGFTPDELADVRLCGGSDFYAALVNAAGESDKCRAFVTQLDKLRITAPELSADRLIWHIYNLTDAMGIYGAMPGGEERRRNLMLLFDYARRFEQSGFKGLFQFVTNLRELMERGEELPAPEGGDGEDAVRIMSIHKSKGLEFPIVFMPDLTHRFNMADTKKDMLLHRDLGPGTRVTDSVRRIRYDTVAHRAAAGRIRTESLSEEMRVLYVGMTRAQEKLIMSAAYPDADKVIDKFTAASDSLPLDPGVLRSASGFADWVVPAVLMYDAHGRGEKPAWICRVEKLSARTLKAEIATEVEKAQTTAPAPELTQEIARRIAFRYPHANVEDLPSKLAPTELKGRVTDEEAALEAGEAPKLAGARRRGLVEIRRPDFAASAPMTAAQRGTALHSFMQYADWKRCADTDGALCELNRLVAEGRLSREQADTVDLPSVTRFFTSPEGRMVLSAPNIMREFKFSVLLPASAFFPGAGDDQVLMQGVVDCCIERDDKLIIIDFKTDAVDETTVLQRAEEYRGQLDAYALAMESITSKSVAQEILYFTRPGIAVYLR